MNTRHHLARLEGPRTNWNEWRAKYPKRRPRLSAINLLSMNLTGYNLEGCDFTESVFDRVTFNLCNLSGADFSGSVFILCSFDEANCPGANFSYSEITCTSFIKTDLTGASFSMSTLVNSDFSGSKMQQADFTDSLCTGVIFSETDIEKALVPRLENIDAEGNNTKALNLVISDSWSPKITVDGIASSLYVMLMQNNRHLIPQIENCRKNGILILGFHESEQKVVTEVQNVLRNYDFITSVCYNDFYEDTTFGSAAQVMASLMTVIVLKIDNVDDRLHWLKGLDKYKDYFVLPVVEVKNTKVLDHIHELPLKVRPFVYGSARKLADGLPGRIFLEITNQGLGAQRKR